MTVKRIRIVFGLFIIFFLALAVRLYFIQFIGINYSQETAVSRNGTELKGINCRGDIYDRNGVPLVNNIDEYLILIEKSKYDDLISEYIKFLDGELMSFNNRRYFGFKTIKYNEKIMKDIISKGGYVYYFKGRYSNPQISAHIIGYYNKYDNTGAYGLERAYNDVLISDNAYKLRIDASGRILKGYGIEYSKKEKPNSIQTTLDKQIQQKVEDIIGGKNYTGAAVVVADVNTGDILCSASYPVFNPSHVENAEGSQLINKVLQNSYPPGSVFKIIVAAAVLENNVAEPEDVFQCTGSEELYGISIKCGKEEGHGSISFQEAFEKSCNCVFIQLGKRLGNEKLLEMASEFGLGKKVLECMQEESSGNLAQLSETTGAGIGNLSIGQGETEITCLQGARIAGIIACGGKYIDLHIIKGQENQNKEKRIISEENANIIKQMMSGVVSRGTGKNAGEDSAGKSGSAQSYINGNKLVHGWFVGFFPVDNPKYIVSVMIENSGGSGEASKIFGEIHDALK